MQVYKLQVKKTNLIIEQQASQLVTYEPVTWNCSNNILLEQI